ncbi:hypothetical protein [Dapis sp. BLCC M172]|uniref:hypothetical protein n=1 Tax=Dapis sp. BLCC M172 TaxID=2975281 RepID=UPI003CF36043
MSQYIVAQELIVALSAKGEELEEPQRLRSLLSPLLCSSPAEQKDFQLRFYQWIERMGFAVDEAIQEDKKAEAVKQELKKIERQWRRLRWVLLAIAILVAIVLTYSPIQQLLSPPANVNGSHTPSSPPNINDSPTSSPPPNGNDIVFPQEWQTILL